MKEMKKLIGKGIIILELFIVLFIILNFAYSKLVIEKTITYRKNAELDEYLKNNSGIKYAFFGGSHVENSINPELVPGAYNFAGGAKTYFEVYHDLKHLIDRGVQLDYVFLELDMHTFSSYLFNFERPILVNLWHYGTFVDHKEISSVLDVPTNKILLDSMFPVIGNGENFFLKKKKSEIYRGYSKRYGDFSEFEAPELSRRRIGRQFMNQEIVSNITLGYFIRTLELAAENNITIVLVKYPVTGIYDESLSSVIDRKEYYGRILGEADKAIDSYHILDYYDLYFDKTEHFSDADHLNYLGAEALSKQVFKDISTKFK